MNAPREDFAPFATDAAELGPLAPIDVVLGQGSREARDELRAQFAVDPVAMLAMADTVELVQRCRSLVVEPGDRYACRLAELVRRAERHVVPRGRPPIAPWLGLLAAVVTFTLLWTFDPLAHWRTTATPGDGLSRLEPSAERATNAELARGRELPVAVPDIRAVEWQSTVELMRKRLGMESSLHLQEALEAGLQSRSDDLGRWLDPRNALVLMRLDHELRGSAAVRQAALRDQGGLWVVDERVQQLAEAITTELPQAIAVADGADQATALAAIPAVAMSVRALIAAGPGDQRRTDSLLLASDWLAARLPHCHDAALVTALAALVEVTAVTGLHGDAVFEHGERLVASVLQPDAENWSRRLPELLGSRIAVDCVAEAGRLMVRLPGLGGDAGRCQLVRELLLGQLRGRHAAGENSAELVAGLLYGSADLLADAERTAVEIQANRWKPVRLAPDFVTVQQLVWSFEPGHRGFARMQRELRQLAVCPEPAVLLPKAAFCLCLATNYAAFTGGLSPRYLAGL